MDFHFVGQVFMRMLSVVPMTLFLALTSFVLSLILSLALSLVEYYKVPFLRLFCNAYVSLFRATPLLPQLFLIYFGLPSFFPLLKNVTRIEAVVIALVLNTAAYMREILRGALESIPSGQVEAAQSVGLTPYQTMKCVLLPQALRLAVPPMGNMLIDVVKGTSLAFTVGVVEITAIAQITSAVNYKYFEAFVALILLYYLIISCLERFQKLLERYLKSRYVI